MKSFNSIHLLVAIAGLTLSFSGFRPASAAEKGKGVEFYLLEDEKLYFNLIYDRPLEDLKLQAAPWIASDNIERYDWSSHYVYLKQPVDIPNEKERKYVSLGGKPFVVTVDGKTCYLGALWSPVSSSLPRGSVAKVDVFGDTLERFHMVLSGSFPPGEAPKNTRDNPTVKEALKRDGQLHEGLQCKLDKVVAERKDGAFSLVYTYTLVNKDKDDLYVLDPEKFHPALFHDFNNGLALRNVETREYTRWPNPRTGEPAHVLNPELSWYKLLRAGESLTRTVNMKLTPPVPPQPGKYQFVFTYVGYGYAVSLAPREPGNKQLFLKDNQISPDPKEADGRIWLGTIESDLTMAIP